MSNPICSCREICLNFNSYGYNCLGKDENGLIMPCGVMEISLSNFKKLITNNKIGDCKCKFELMDTDFCTCGLFTIHHNYNKNINIILSNFLEKWNSFKDLNDDSIKCQTAKFHLEQYIIV